MDTQGTCRHCGNPYRKRPRAADSPAPTAATNAGGPSTANVPSAGAPLAQRHQRQTDTRRQHRHLQAEHLAATAQHLAHDLRTEHLAQPTHQTGWAQGPIAGYTAAALPLLGQARSTLAAAVTTDRAAGSTWHEIAAVLGTSPDTAVRHYRTWPGQIYSARPRFDYTTFPCTNPLIATLINGVYYG